MKKVVRSLVRRRPDDGGSGSAPNCLSDDLGDDQCHRLASLLSQHEARLCSAHGVRWSCSYRQYGKSHPWSFVLRNAPCPLFRKSTCAGKGQGDGIVPVCVAEEECGNSCGACRPVVNSQHTDTVLLLKQSWERWAEPVRSSSMLPGECEEDDLGRSELVWTPGEDAALVVAAGSCGGIHIVEQLFSRAGRSARGDQPLSLVDGTHWGDLEGARSNLAAAFERRLPGRDQTACIKRLRTLLDPPDARFIQEPQESNNSEVLTPRSAVLAKTGGHISAHFSLASLRAMADIRADDWWFANLGDVEGDPTAQLVVGDGCDDVGDFVLGGVLVVGHTVSLRCMKQYLEAHTLLYELVLQTAIADNPVDVSSHPPEVIPLRAHFTGRFFFSHRMSGGEASASVHPVRSRWWSPRAHSLFSSSFRRAVFLLLAIYEFHHQETSLAMLPLDVLFEIVERLSRVWGSIDSDQP